MIRIYTFDLSKYKNHFHTQIDEYEYKKIKTINIYLVDLADLDADQIKILFTLAYLKTQAESAPFK